MGRTTTTTATTTTTTTRRSTRLAIKVEDKTQDAASAPSELVTNAKAVKAATKAKGKAAPKPTAKAATKPTAKAAIKPTAKAAVKRSENAAGKGTSKAGKAAGKDAGKAGKAVEKAAAKAVAKSSTGKVVAKVKKAAKETAPPKVARAKKQTPPEPAAPRQRKRKQDLIDTAADDTPAAKPVKRPRKSKNVAAALKQENDVEMLPTTAPPRPRNRTDPCEMLPTEVWHQVLSLLPLSQVATSSLVSKTWLDGARAWPIWKQICEFTDLGKPKRKYKTYMSLVCAQSYFICDKCHSFSNGLKDYNASEIPLPVDIIVKKAEKPKKEQTQDHAKNKSMSKGKNIVKEDKGMGVVVIKRQDADQTPKDDGQGSTDLAADDQASDDIVERWNLCHGCRMVYYREYPEDYRRLPGESEDDYEHRRSDRITKTRACSTYHLTENDIFNLDYREVRNPHHRSWYPMRLYDRHEIQDRALEVHGGWVGVEACWKGIAKARRLACKLRDAAVLGDSNQPQKKKAKKENATQGSSHGASQEATQGPSQEVSQGSTQVPLLEVKQELATQLANSSVFATSDIAPMAAMPILPVVAAGAQ